MPLDLITGLPDQRAFERDLRTLGQQPGSGEWLLLHIDMAGFSEINREFGFEQADRVLRQVAQAMASSLAGHPLPDVAEARIFRRRALGDEFDFLVRADLTAVLALADRLRQTFDVLSREVSTLLGAPVRLSFRGSIAPLRPEDGMTHLDAALSEVAALHLTNAGPASTAPLFPIACHPCLDSQSVAWPSELSRVP